MSSQNMSKISRMYARKQLSSWEKKVRKRELVSIQLYIQTQYCKLDLGNHFFIPKSWKCTEFFFILLFKKTFQRNRNVPPIK